MVVANFVTRALLIVAGMLFPGYKSFKAVKRANVAEQQRMLKYWLVLSILSAFMLVLEPLLQPRVPLYAFIKIAFVVFLVHPKWAGFEKLYDSLVQPFLDQHEAQIDMQLNKASAAVEEQSRNFVPAVTKLAKQGQEMAKRTLSKKSAGVKAPPSSKVN